MDYTNHLHVIYDDGMLGVGGANFHYIFGYERTGLESMVIDGHEWLYRVPTPTFWRATTDNDRGNQFNVRAAQWLAADYVVPCTGIELTVDDRHFDTPPIAPATNEFTDHETADSVTITYTYETVTTPTAMVTVTYRVEVGGKLTVTSRYYGVDGLPELPVFGLRMVMPTAATGFDYDGLSGETYPDRMAGATKGHFHVDGLPVTPYLVPQENGMHMETSALTITRDSTLNNADPNPGPYQLNIKAVDRPFAFSCLPYTSAELENATHQDELPPARRTVLVLAGAVRGVGGIDSWGADVTAPYHVDSSRDHEVSFQIIP